MSRRTNNSAKSQEISFFVPGIPRGKGSTKSWINPKTQKIITTSTTKGLKVWESDIKLEAGLAWAEDPTREPVAVSRAWVLPRPKSHYYWSKKRYGELKEDAPIFAAKKPDIDKLTRALFDALTGVIYYDDRQVCKGTEAKIYGNKPGVHVTLWELDDNEA